MDRFGRTRLLLGDAAMNRLTRAHVLVAGLGAVGSYAVEGLARAGVGCLTLVDCDVIQPSNINRQLFALESTLGAKKTDVAAQRVRDINPQCRVHAWHAFLDDDSLPEILDGRPDIVVDAIDGLNAKAATIAHARQRGIPVIASMGAATRTDPTAIRVADLSQTFGCPLARFLRKRLRKRGIERGVRCVFSIEPVPQRGDAEKPDVFGPLEIQQRGRPRHVLGSFSCVTGIFGLIAAREAIFQLIGADEEAPPRGEES